MEAEGKQDQQKVAINELVWSECLGSKLLTHCA